MTIFSLTGLAIVKLDRPARSVRHLTVSAELEALGARLVVLDQAMDTADPPLRPPLNATFPHFVSLVPAGPREALWSALSGLWPRQQLCPQAAATEKPNRASPRGPARAEMGGRSDARMPPAERG